MAFPIRWISSGYGDNGRGPSYTKDGGIAPIELTDVPFCECLHGRGSPRAECPKRHSQTMTEGNALQSANTN
jgi:hypothetical protein